MKKQIAVYTRMKANEEKIRNKKIIDYILEKNNLLDNNYNIIFFEDIGYRGTDNNRPDLENLMLDIENQKIDILVTPNINTLSRDPLFLDSEIFSRLIDFNVDLITIEGKIDIINLQLEPNVFKEILEKKYGISYDKNTLEYSTSDDCEINRE